MYVTSLTCNYGVIDEEMVASLIKLTLSDLDNASNFPFAVVYVECVSCGRRDLVMS